VTIKYRDEGMQIYFQLQVGSDYPCFYLFLDDDLITIRDSSDLSFAISLSNSRILKLILFGK